MDKKNSQNKEKHPKQAPTRATITDNKDEAHKATSNTGQEQPDSKQSAWIKWTPFERMSIITQVVSAITLILYTCFSCSQWGEMKRLNTITEKAFEQGTRARFDPDKFVSVGSELHKDGEVLPVNVTIKNIGHSNARVAISGELLFGHPGVLSPPCDNTPAKFEMFGPINVGKADVYQFDGKQLNADQIALEETGRLQVFAIGKIRSTDEIGETHCTAICAYLEPTESVLRVRAGQAPKQIWKKCPGNGEED